MLPRLLTIEMDNQGLGKVVVKSLKFIYIHHITGRPVRLVNMALGVC